MSKTKLQEIKEKVANPNLSLTEIANLLGEWQKVLSSLLQDPTKKEERMLAFEVLAEAINVAIFNSVDKWEKGEIEPNEEEVFFLYNWYADYKQVQVNLAAYEKAINETKEIDEEEKNQKIKLLKKDIEKLKKYEPTLIKLFQKEKAKYQQKKNEEASVSPSETLPEENQVSSTFLASTDTGKRNKKDKKFPIWGIILIILAVLVVAGIAGYFILERKERLKPKKTKNK